VVTVDGVLEREQVLPQRWNLIEPFGTNPPVSREYSGIG
jgi:hypothetical protein